MKKETKFGIVIVLFYQQRSVFCIILFHCLAEVPPPREEGM